MVRVLLFEPSDKFGGAERSVMNILKHLDNETVQIVLVGNEQVFGGIGRCQFVSTRSLGISEGFVNFTTALRDARRLSRYAQQMDCTILLGFLHYGAMLAGLCRFTSYFKLKTIASPRTPSRAAIKLLVGNKGRRVYLWHFMIHLFARFSTKLIVASNGLKDECVKYYGASPESVVVVHNGMDLELVERAGKALPVSTPRAGLRVIAVGRLVPEKDMTTLIRAFGKVSQQFQDVELWIVGEGSERESLERLSNELGLSEKIRFLGFQANPFEWIKSADIFVHTALYEGFGHVILEAMACGVPVVATDCDFGPREIIQDGNNGCLVRMSDPEQLAQVLARLLADSALRARLASAGSTSLKKFSVMSMAKGYEQVFVETDKMSYSLRRMLTFLSRKK